MARFARLHNSISLRKQVCTIWFFFACFAYIHNNTLLVKLRTIWNFTAHFARLYNNILGFDLVKQVLHIWNFIARFARSYTNILRFDLIIKYYLKSLACFVCLLNNTIEFDKYYLKLLLLIYLLYFCIGVVHFFVSLFLFCSQ